MQRLTRTAYSMALASLIVLSVGACSNSPTPIPVAATPPPPPPPPAPPPQPTADEQIQTQLTQWGAAPTDRGYTVTLRSAKFGGGNVSFAADEDATLRGIADLLKSSPHLRVQIENYSRKRGEEASQEHAGAVLRNLIAKGADEDRVQAQGLVDPSAKPEVQIIFSNAEGEFPPTTSQKSG